MVLFWLIGVCDGWAVVLQGAGRPKISFWTESHLPCSLSYVHVHRATLVLHVAHSACIILNCLYIVRLWASLRGAHHRHVTLDMFLYFYLELTSQYLLGILGLRFLQRVCAQLGHLMGYPVPFSASRVNPVRFLCFIFSGIERGVGACSCSLCVSRSGSCCRTCKKLKLSGTVWVGPVMYLCI